MDHIFITADLAANLHNALKVASDRGAFKFEEFGTIAALSNDLVKSIRENKFAPQLDTVSDIKE